MSNFAQPVSMPCTQEQYKQHLRQPLLELGYEESFSGGFGPDKKNIIHAYKTGQIAFIDTTFQGKYHIPTFSPQLFIAIAAMRTGEEIHVGEYMKCLKTYKDDGHCYEKDELLRVDTTNRCSTARGVVSDSYDRNYWRKATLQELIDKFTEKEFVLPEHGWHVVVTECNQRVCSEWRGGHMLAVGMIVGMLNSYEKGHARSIKGEHFDFGIEITTDQFMEHVYNPWRAGQEKPFVPKRGDVVRYEETNGEWWLQIYDSTEGHEDIGVGAMLIDGSANGIKSISCTNQRTGIATDSEKQLLFDALAKQGKRYNAEKFCIEDIPVNTHRSMIDEWEPIQEKDHRVKDSDMACTQTLCEFIDIVPKSVSEYLSDPANLSKVFASLILDECQGDFRKAKDVYQNVGSQLERLLSAEKRERGAKVRELKGLNIISKYNI